MHMLLEIRLQHRDNHSIETIISIDRSVLLLAAWPYSDHDHIHMATMYPAELGVNGEVYVFLVWCG